MKKILNFTLLACLSFTLMLTGCQNNTATSKATDQIGNVSLENPISIDKEAKTVTVLSSVNGKYFNEPTRHASVFKEGSNGAKSIFTAYGTPEDFYDALIAIGGTPGENMTLDNKETTYVKGDTITVSVTWNGADTFYDINDVIIDSNGKPIDIKFGGNLDTAKAKQTGCLTCLDSCPVGIISNATYTYGAVEKRNEVAFTGNKEVLPEDGTYVAVTYKLVK